MDLYEKRERRTFWKQILTGIPQPGTSAFSAWRSISRTGTCQTEACVVALDQLRGCMPRWSSVVASRFARAYGEIKAARETGRIALLITMEGIEPLGTDLNQLRAFTSWVSAHRPYNARSTLRDTAEPLRRAFVARGSDHLRTRRSARIREAGHHRDLAHINPAGFDENFLDYNKATHRVAYKCPSLLRYRAQHKRCTIKMIGERSGVIGINSILVSAREKKAQWIVTSITSIHRHLIGIEEWPIGFDFFEFIYRQWPESRQRSWP